MPAERIAGVCFFKRDGVQYSLRGSFSVEPLSFTKEGIAGVDGVHGYKETAKVPSIEGEITDRGLLSIKDLEDVRDSTITAELANGKVYVLRNAWFAGDAKLDAVDGKVTVKFEGVECRESLSL